MRNEKVMRTREAMMMTMTIRPLSTMLPLMSPMLIFDWFPSYWRRLSLFSSHCSATFTLIWVPLMVINCKPRKIEGIKSDHSVIYRHSGVCKKFAILFAVLYNFTQQCNVYIRNLWNYFLLKSWIISRLMIPSLKRNADYWKSHEWVCAIAHFFRHIT